MIPGRNELHMVHLPLHLRELMECGREHGLVSDEWSVDLGYLVHSLLARLLGPHAPKPFDVQDAPASRPAPDRLLHVLAYAGQDIGALQAQAGRHGDDEAQSAVDWARAGSKPLPFFQAGQRLGFRTRVCPVVRIGRRHPRFAPGAEVDPYLALVERHLAEAERANPGVLPAQLKPGVVAALPPREAVYGNWLAARLGDAVVLDLARPVQMRDTRLWRRGTPGTETARTMHKRDRTRGTRAVIGRRDALFEGTLAVQDPDGLRALLARGLGRHRAFGFGMVLLRSAAPC